MELVSTSDNGSQEGEPINENISSFDNTIQEQIEIGETGNIVSNEISSYHNPTDSHVPRCGNILRSWIPLINCNAYKEYISLKINDQDTIQKLNVILTLCMEFYRILMGSLLLSFVPQKCGDHVCGITENLHSGGAYYIVYIVNFMTLISFFILYLVEVKRENKLITYLDVNTSKPTDAFNVSINMRALPEIKRENILYIDKIYQQIGCCAIAVYVFNTIVSAIVIYDNYLDNKTITAFLTNVLFMGNKVAEVYSIANTENNIFFSAYLKKRVQYNDVDPDKILYDDIGQNIDSMQEEY